jgi:hypothetical protein
MSTVTESVERTHAAPAIAAKKNGVTVTWASSALAVNAAVASAMPADIRLPNTSAGTSTSGRAGSGAPKATAQARRISACSTASANSGASRPPRISASLSSPLRRRLSTSCRRRAASDVVAVA